MPENRPNLDSLFEAASDIESAVERAAFLNKSCGDDLTLRNQVERLLQSDEHAGSFLNRPPAELEATVLPGKSVGDLAAVLEAGLAPAFSNGEAVVVGGANHSVLKSLGNTVTEVPRVVLRESASEGDDPITRPTSPEMPISDSDNRYQLQGEIARGGMGAILKGRDTDLGRDLAIKVLLDAHKNKPEVIQRFVEEAQIGGQLQHPGIAPVYELGQFADQRPFFSMKLVKGKTLSELLAERQQSSDDQASLLGIFEQVCQTMAYAHSRGVIHRDLKPANIMVGAFGEVQVMDWGLAKVLAAGGVADEKKANEKQNDVSIIQTMRSVGSNMSAAFGSTGSETQMGSVMGTPAYMPPEQALGEVDRLDERADVFGLGAILCEILTGKPPYVGTDGMQIFRQASRGKLDDCHARLESSGVDQPLIDLAKHALAAEPEQRIRNASLVAKGITQYLAGVQERLKQAEFASAEAEARIEHAMRRRKLVMAIAGLMVLIATGAAYSALEFRRLADENLDLANDNDRKRLAAVDAQNKIGIEKERVEQKRKLATALNEKLQYKQYISDMRLVRQAYHDGTVTRVHELLEKHIPGTGEADRRSFEWYYWWRTSHLETDTVDMTGRPFGSIAAAPNQRLFVSHAWAGRLEIRDAATLELIAYENEGTDFGLEMEFSADSTVLATVGGNKDRLQLWDTNEAGIRNTRDLMVRHVINPPGDISCFAFSKTDAKLAIADQSGQVTFWDAHSGAALGGSLECNVPVRDMAFSPESSRLAVLTTPTSTNSAVTIYNLSDGEVIRSLSGRQRSIVSLAWSRSLERNVLATGSNTGVVSLWDGVSFANLDTLHAIGGVDSLEFSPDGSRLAALLTSRFAVQVWETQSSELVAIVRGHDKVGVGAAFVTNGKELLSTGIKGVLGKWDLSQTQPFQVVKSANEQETQNQLRWLLGRDTPLRRSDFVLLEGLEGFTEMPGGDLTGLSDNGEYLAVFQADVGETMRLKLWKKTDSEPDLVYEKGGIAKPSDPLIDMAVSNDGSKVVWARPGRYPTANRPGWEGLLAILDVRRDTIWSKPMPLNRCVALSPDGNTLAVMDGHKSRTWVLDISDGKVHEEELDTHPDRKGWLQHPKCFQIPPGLATECAFSPDGEFLAIATSHSDIFVLNVRTREVMWGIRERIEELLRECSTGTDAGWSVAEHLVNGGKGHASVVSSLAFSPDGKLLVTGGNDNTVRVWDFQTGELRATLLGHNSPVQGVRFSHQSVSRQTITSIDASGKILVWSAATENELEKTAAYWAARSRRHRDIGDVANAEADRIRFQELRAAEEIRDDEAFKKLCGAGNWVEAAKVGRRILNATPDSPKLWLETSPIIALGNDQAAYRDFCSSYVRLFANTDETWLAEQVCKSCLILPGGIDLDRLPYQNIAKALDEQAVSPGIVPWLWSARALVAYRSGDPRSAIKHVQQSENSEPPDLAKMINSSILALAHHDLGQLGLSYQSWAGTRRRIRRIEDPDTGFPTDYDGQIAAILAREARSLLMAPQSRFADARTDWLQSVATNLDMPASERFRILCDFGELSEAAEIGWQIVQQSPDNTEAWLKLAPLYVAAGNHEGYREFCLRMSKQFAGTDDVQIAERTCKACLLHPNSIDLDQLPHVTLAKSLDQNPTGENTNWFWLCRALVAYRSNDAEAAVAYVQKSEHLNPSEIAHALNLSIRALAYAKLGQASWSERDADVAFEIVERLLKSEFNPGSHHDLLMSRILLRELRANGYVERTLE